MVVSIVRILFPKQAKMHELSAKDAAISDAIWIIGAILYFVFLE